MNISEISDMYYEVFAAFKRVAGGRWNVVVHMMSGGYYGD